MTGENEEKDIANLLLRYCGGETAEAETRRVEEWMAAREENRGTAVRMCALMMAADISAHVSAVDTERALKQAHRKMDSRRWPRLRRWARALQRTATFLLIPIIAIASLKVFNRDKVENRMLEFKTAPGTTASAELPDGTGVVLNSSSTLRYPARFDGGERRVELTGEAFFSVVKDGEPFIVDLAGGSSIRVYGTEFNVSAEPDGDEVSATLVKGEIGFSYREKGQQKEWRMHPGEKLVYDKAGQSVSLSSANIEVETSWIDGRLIFKDTPFEEVLKKLGKRYNVEFVLKNSRLKHDSFTANFGQQRLERILEYFRVASGIRFKYVDNAGENTERQVIEVY